MSNSTELTGLLVECLDGLESEVSRAVKPMRDKALLELVKTAQHSGAMDVITWLLENGHASVSIDAMTRFWKEGPGKEYGNMKPEKAPSNA